MTVPPPMPYSSSSSRKAGKSRSELYARALEAYFKAAEVREMDARYETAYRRKPETLREVAEVAAFAKLSARALEKEDW